VHDKADADDNLFLDQIKNP